MNNAGCRTLTDFLPYVASDDLAIISEVGEFFFKGGTASLDLARFPANPAIVDPATGHQAFPRCEPHADTITAMLSQPSVGERDASRSLRHRFASFLPDTASAIFYPGWDVTLSAEADGARFLSTQGLGSPFPEDMKLCAAANGMWPAASPDASRTFQGAIERLPRPDSLLARAVTYLPCVSRSFEVRSPTAIPLLDHELGFHPKSPPVTDYQRPSHRGWDGEYGPFLEHWQRKTVVNFADIRKVDYVQNALNGTMDASLTREIHVQEVVARMRCLRRAIQALDDGYEPRLAKAWLVSAEHVSDWSAGAKGWSLPKSIFGSPTTSLTQPHSGISGPGYLFVFAWVDYEQVEDVHGDYPERSRAACSRVSVCQVTPESFHFCPPPASPKNHVPWFDER